MNYRRKGKEMYVIHSESWGLLGAYLRKVDAIQAFKFKVAVQTKYPWQIPHGKVPLDQKLYKWNHDTRQWDEVING